MRFIIAIRFCWWKAFPIWRSALAFYSRMFFLLFFCACESTLLCFDFAYLHYIEMKVEPSIKRDKHAAALLFISVTIWHKRIINNSFCLIRNICVSHYLDLSTADIFLLFIQLSFAIALPLHILQAIRSYWCDSRFTTHPLPRPSIVLDAPTMDFDMNSSKKKKMLIQNIELT